MNRQPRTKKPLASTLLKDTKDVLDFVEAVDVTGLSDWLQQDADRPLICVGSGGQRTSYASLLYEIASNVARTVTPLDFASISPAVIRKSKVLLLSSSGKNQDIKFAAKRALEYNSEHTACITFNDSDENAMLKMIKGKNCFLFKNPFKDDFISVRGKIFLFGLLYKAFGGKEKFSDKLRYDGHYEYFINRVGVLPALSKIKNLTVLYGSYGEPVAKEIESVMAESSVAPVTVTDYRNYCHGRFMFAGNHCQSRKVAETDTCAVLLVTPRERKLAEGVRRLAMTENMPIVEIAADLDDSLASIQLLIDSLVFMFDFAENHHGINPNDPVNFSSIDKRAPIHSVSYVKDLMSKGEMVI